MEFSQGYMVLRLRSEPKSEHVVERGILACQKCVPRLRWASYSFEKCAALWVVRFFFFCKPKVRFFACIQWSKMCGLVWGMGWMRERNSVEHEFYILLSTRLKCKMHIFMCTLVLCTCCSRRCIIGVPLHIPYLDFELARLAHHF